jgi:CheY-like chemotaxis protein
MAMQILIADADSALRAYLAAELPAWGIEVVTAADLAEAADILFAGRKFDAVVFDPDMVASGEDIIAFLSGILEDDTPLVLFSASDAPLPFFTHDAYLRKPTATAAELADALRSQPVR